MNMDDQQTVRTRTIRWDDPLVGARAAPTLAGIEYLRAMARGELPGPPIMALMNITLGAIEQGMVEFRVVPAEFHYNPIGVVHGGLAATICDSAMGCAIHSTLPAGMAYTTLEFKVSFLRSLTVQTGEVRCIGTVVHGGSRVATAEARIVDRHDKLYVHATTTCLIFPALGEQR
jgi:uncharacterized protein (TIGR00369 family)